jgi:hypothetical protein
MHGTQDQILDSGREPGRFVIVDHRSAPFVAALFEDALGGNVARDIVGVTADPETGGIEFLFQTQRIIDDHLTRQKNHGEIIAEIPGLNVVGKLGRQRFAAVEFRKVDPRIIAGVTALFSLLFPLFACR